MTDVPKATPDPAASFALASREDLRAFDRPLEKRDGAPQRAAQASAGVL